MLNTGRIGIAAQVGDLLSSARIEFELGLKFVEYLKLFRKYFIKSSSTTRCHCSRSKVTGKVGTASGKILLG